VHFHSTQNRCCSCSWYCQGTLLLLPLLLPLLTLLLLLLLMLLLRVPV
jgi:hypothetical protein